MLQVCGRRASMVFMTRVISTRLSSMGVNMFCSRSMTSSGWNSLNVSTIFNHFYYLRKACTKVDILNPVVWMNI